MIDTTQNLVLTRKFFIRPVLVVAKDLLGKVLIKKNGNRVLAGRIIEVEAYDGSAASGDKASHSFNGKTKRNEVMFNEGGYFYVYFTYGTHYCCNVVTGKRNHGEAVLIRGVEPLLGINKMIENRFGRKLKSEKEIYNLTSGPGKVCKAFDFKKEHSGLDLTISSIFIINQPKLKKDMIGISKRIGITKSVKLPWRFFEIGNPYLSR
jgi:DNA-3-methyladenine glycosylase